MKTNYYCLRVNLLDSIKKRIEKEIKLDKTNTKTFTIIVREALDLYFKQKDKEREIITGTILHLPVQEETGITGEEIVEIKKGLIIPEFKPKIIIDPEIEGETLSKHQYVDMGMVRRAKRNKTYGRSYDITLEKYFDRV